MRTISIALLFFLIGAPLAYVGLNLRGESETDAMVRLLGPGNQPSVCVARAKPHFQRMEERFTEAANVVLSLEQAGDVSFGYAGARVRNIGSPNEEPPNDILDQLTDIFNSFGESNYYAPAIIRKIDGRVHVIAGACGMSEWNWIKKNIRLPSQGRLISTAYFYRPDGVANLETCSEPIDVSKPATICEVEISDNWSWYAEWLNFEAQAE